MKLWACLVFSLTFLLTACKKDQAWEPILFSKDVCHHCKMVISDTRFGAEFVSEKGKVFKYDSIECMGHDLEDQPTLKGSAFVVDSTQKEKMIPAGEANYTHDENLRSPMGKGILAFESRAKLDANNPRVLSALTWNQILALIGRPDLLKGR